MSRRSGSKWPGACSRRPTSRSRRSHLPAASVAQRRCAARSCARCTRARPNIAGGSVRPPPDPRQGELMDIAIVAFDNMAALDAIGPFEVLAHLPDATVTWVGLDVGVKRTEEG